MTNIFESILSGGHSGRAALLGPEACTYAELRADVERLAGRLAELGVAAGCAVTCALPHGRAHIAALLAVRRLGAVAVTANPRAPAKERAHILADSGSRFLLSEEGSADGQSVEVLLSCWCSVFDRPLRQDYPPASAMVIYTSGSTSLPKGVLLSDAAISANTEAVANYLALSPGDRLVVFTPPNFAYAISQVLTHLWVGGALLPWKDGLFDPLALIEAMRAASATGLQANPTIFQALLDIGKGLELPSVRYVMSGGQPLSTALARRLQSFCPNARIASMYGCTENAPRIAFKWLPTELTEDRQAWPVGKPVDGTAITLLDRNGVPVQAGEVGEIAIRGTSLMSLYVGTPEAMAERMAGDWFLTRDLGWIDAAGDLNIVGRADNVILVGHEKVSPEEVEAALLSVPGIEDVAVGALQDERLHQVPVALLVASAPAADVLQAAKRELRTKLAHAKMPRRFLAVEKIPRTSYGKIDRARVRALIALLADTLVE